MDNTQYLELGKPTQEDFYDVEVQNRNMDIIDREIKSIDEYRNIDTFSSFSELDIRDDGSLTIDDMLEALNNKHSDLNSNAIFVERIDATSLISPNGEAGQIMVFTRLTGAVLLYVADNKRFFYGVTQYSSGVQYKWQGWKELLNTDSGTFTGTLKINSSSPTLEMTDTSNNGGTKVYKNASSEADYGTYISDIASDGTCDILILRREGSTNADKISLRVQSADGSTYDTYKIYGEHNKPTPADIGAATKEEVQTAQSTANTAKTNAATAQSTANTAKSNAATAQSTADVATTKADNAQSSANMAQTTADEALSKANNAATTKTYTVNVSESEWGEDDVNGGYYCEKSVTGLLPTDNPIIDIILGSDIDANEEFISAWSVVTRVVTDTDVIILYANETYPQVALSLQIKVVR